MQVKLKGRVIGGRSCCCRTRDHKVSKKCWLRNLKVNTQETENRPESDISRVLQGKLSGVFIEPSNGSSEHLPVTQTASRQTFPESRK